MAYLHLYRSIGCKLGCHNIFWALGRSCVEFVTLKSLLRVMFSSLSHASVCTRRKMFLRAHGDRLVLLRRAWSSQCTCPCLLRLWPPPPTHTHKNVTQAVHDPWVTLLLDIEQTVCTGDNIFGGACLLSFSSVVSPIPWHVPMHSWNLLLGVPTWPLLICAVPLHLHTCCLSLPGACTAPAGPCCMGVLLLQTFCVSVSVCQCDSVTPCVCRLCVFLVVWEAWTACREVVPAGPPPLT